MRRPLVRVLVVVTALLVVVAGAYAAYWYVAAGQMRSAIADWASQSGDLQVKVGEVAVSGFPDRLIATVASVEATRSQGSLPWAYRADGVRASRALTGGSTLVTVAGPQTLTYTADGQVHTVRARANSFALELRQTASGGFAGFGLLAARLTVERPVAQPMTIGRLSFNMGVGNGAPGAIPDKSRFAVRIEDLKLPEHRRGALGDTIEQLGFNAILNQPIAGFDLPASLARWRDADGYLTLTEVILKWGTLDMSGLGSGVLRLDAQFRPTGGLHAGLRDYLTTIDAFHAARRLSDEARAAVQQALGFLGARGAAGGGRLGLPVEVRDGNVVVGPATLGTVKPVLPGAHPAG